ncbi:hypothetical protein ACROYT_G020653 [Oculina patagonica]
MIVATFLVHFLTVHLRWKFIEAKTHCHKGTCPKYPLDVYGDAVQDSEFVGHVFHNSVTLNPVQCYTWCIQDCRCLSFNYKENNEDKYCELNEGNHFTNETSLKNSPGSSYYILRREYHRQTVTSCIAEVTCTNGCCENNPCLNGGTCNEICEPASVRYNCSCPVPFDGKHCEIQLRKSCQDYKAAGVNKSGLYAIENDSNQTFQVFCDFDSEPGFVWNLIESFSLSNKHLFQKDVVFYNYSDSSAVSGDSPNWQAYLIKRHNLLWLRDQSTHWRATCRYNTDGTVYRDYLRASIEDFDIIRVIPSVISSCQKYELVNIRGNECTNCTAATWYRKGFYPLHIDSFFQGVCDFNGNQTGDVITSEDNFGYYGTVNPKFRCTSSLEATTQFWIGGQ